MTTPPLQPGHSLRRPASKRARAGPAWANWLIGPCLLVALVIAFALLRTDPLTQFAVAGLIALGGVGLWIMTSILWPARAERGCPSCGVDALVRMDASSTIGIRCSRCGFEDEAQSSWLLAEEEGPLEDIVLAQRRGRRPAGRGSRVSKVDSAGSAGYDKSQGSAAD